MRDHAMWMIFSHSWKITAVLHRRANIDDGDVWDEDERDVTDVLYCCSCGEVKTKTVQGTWTLEQVKGGK